MACIEQVIGSRVQGRGLVRYMYKQNDRNKQVE